jgi:pimeloyl-ACP methyl ester carboxylesterase
MARSLRRSGRLQSVAVPGTSGDGKNPPMPAPRERQEEVAGLPAFWREADPPAARLAPVLYLHGNPTSSDDWLPFLERTGGIAPDLPGFGRSGKPASFDYSIPGYARFLEAFLAHLGVDRYRLLVHDWGGVGLALAQAAPERVERLAIVNSVPLLPGYRWHRYARIWRTPVLGELFMGAATRFALKRMLSRAVSLRGPELDAFVDRIWAHNDHGTQRAVLRLYRAAPEHELARAGERLGELRCPALVVWGDRDAYIAPEFAERYAEALGGPVRVEHVDAGHWVWLDRPETIGELCDFLLASDA